MGGQWTGREKAVSGAVEGGQALVQPIWERHGQVQLRSQGRCGGVGGRVSPCTAAEQLCLETFVTAAFFYNGR